MVLLITTAIYPHDKAREVGKKFIEVFKKYPPDPSLSKVLSIAVKATIDGIKVIGISEIKKGKFNEALDRATKSNLEYASIEGFKWEMETYMDVNEAMKNIGMEAPQQAPEIY